MQRSDFIHLVIGTATLLPCFLGVLLYAPSVDAPLKTTPDVPPPARKTEPVITQRVADEPEPDAEQTAVTTVTTTIPFYVPYTAEELPMLTAGEDLYRELPEELVESCFTVAPIPDHVYSRMNGLSYQDNEKVPIGDLSYIRVLHYTQNGTRRIGEMVLNKLIAEDVKDIMRSLYDAQYPIERMVLVDNYNADDSLALADNNSYGFNFRGANVKNLTARALGRAVNINPVYNPYVSVAENGAMTVSPKKGIAYANRDELSAMMISEADLCYQLFTAHGFTWGGSWGTTKNYMYFEKKGTNAQ